MNTELMFSNKTDHWATPQDFYDKLDSEFHFTFDPCPLYSTFDGLSIDWYGNVFCNPPYSDVKNWLKKARYEIAKGNCNLVVFLVPARTDTKWFHEHVLHRSEIRFLKGRLKFGGGQNSAPFPSMLAVFRK